MDRFELGEICPIARPSGEALERHEAGQSGDAELAVAEVAAQRMVAHRREVQWRRSLTDQIDQTDLGPEAAVLAAGDPTGLVGSVAVTKSTPARRSAAVMPARSGSTGLRLIADDRAPERGGLSGQPLAAAQFLLHREVGRRKQPPLLVV